MKIKIKNPLTWSGHFWMHDSSIWVIDVLSPAAALAQLSKFNENAHTKNILKRVDNLSLVGGIVSFFGAKNTHVLIFKMTLER